MKVVVTARENEFISGREDVFDIELKRFSSKTIKEAIINRDLSFSVQYFLVGYELVSTTSKYKTFTYFTKKIAFNDLDTIQNIKRSRSFKK